MPESPMVSARVPKDWQQQIQEIARAAGRKEAEVVREALAGVSRADWPSGGQGCERFWRR